MSVYQKKGGYLKKTVKNILKAKRANMAAMRVPQPLQSTQQPDTGVAHSLAVRLFEPAMEILSGHEIMNDIGAIWTREFRTRLLMMSVFVLSAAAGLMMFALYNDGEVDKDQTKIYLYVMLALKSIYLIGEVLVGLYMFMQLVAAGGKLVVTGDFIKVGSTNVARQSAVDAYARFRSTIFMHRSYQWAAMAMVYVSYLMATLKFCDHDVLGILNRYYLCAMPVVLMMLLSVVWFVSDHFSRTAGRGDKASQA
jgi:hypothetical protein